MADTVVFVVDMNENEPIDQQGLLALKTIQATGLSSQSLCFVIFTLSVLMSLFNSFQSFLKKENVLWIVVKYDEGKLLHEEG